MPVKSAEEVQTYQMEQTFTAEDVKQSFNCKVYYFDPATNEFKPAPFKETGNATGRIIYMDLFFQVNSLYDYSTY